MMLESQSGPLPAWVDFLKPLGTFVLVFQQITQDRQSVLTDVLRDSELFCAAKYSG